MIRILNTTVQIYFTTGASFTRVPNDPRRQIKGEFSPGLTERGEPGPEDEKRGAPGSVEPENAFLSASGGDGGEYHSIE